MISYLKKAIYLVTLLWFSVSSAGSYDDYFAAITRDDSATVQELLNRGFDPNTINAQGLTGLYLALRDSSMKTAQVLIDWPKTNIESRTPQDESPLMMASLRGQTEIVRKLIARDADVNKTGWTPLHYAATSAHLDIIELLLENHAYIDAESPNGTTPLMMAAQYGSPEAVKLLLEAGADASLKNQRGLGAIDFAYQGGRTDSAQLISTFVRAGQPKGKW
ncbi:MAG: ankyrin repeat domain-containing protein [Ramlibacter sp.]